jgi:hypothetical protein
MLPEWYYDKLLLQGKRRRMTLITGAFCADGLWIIGDREESGIGGKRSVRKIFREIEPKGKWVLIIATAGWPALADLAARRIATWATSTPSVFIRRHEEQINSILEVIYDKHIRKQSLKRREKLQREFTLIIGIKDCVSRRLYLYKTQDDMLHAERPHACAGAGEELGNYLLDRLGDSDLQTPTLTRDQLLDLLLFVLREAKNSVDGVGQETEGHFLPIQGAIAEYHWRTPLTDLQLPSLSESMNHFWLTPSDSRRLAGQR